MSSFWRLLQDNECACQPTLMRTCVRETRDQDVCADSEKPFRDFIPKKLLTVGVADHDYES